MEALSPGYDEHHLSESALPKCPWLSIPTPISPHIMPAHFPSIYSHVMPAHFPSIYSHVMPTHFPSIYSHVMPTHFPSIYSHVMPAQIPIKTSTHSFMNGFHFPSISALLYLRLTNNFLIKSPLIYLCVKSLVYPSVPGSAFQLHYLPTLCPLISHQYFHMLCPLISHKNIHMLNFPSKHPLIHL